MIDRVVEERALDWPGKNANANNAKTPYTTHPTLPYPGRETGSEHELAPGTSSKPRQQRFSGCSFASSSHGSVLSARVLLDFLISFFAQVPARWLRSLSGTGSSRHPVVDPGRPVAAATETTSTVPSGRASGGNSKSPPNFSERRGAVHSTTGGGAGRTGMEKGKNQNKVRTTRWERNVTCRQGRAERERERERRRKERGNGM